MKHILAIVAVYMLAANPAHGEEQQPCGPAEVAHSYLKEKYGETPVEAGVASGGGMVELLTSPDGSTWTLLWVEGDKSCVFIAGKFWGRLTPDDPGI